MGITGGLVALRPQIATLLSPPAPRSAGCGTPPDWNRAAREITAYSHSEINRIYGPSGSDTRWHFRVKTNQPAIYRHIVYDACAARVLGAIDLGWMDWTVDLHHNLLAGRSGRRWAGFIGIALLVSSLSGLLLWLVTKPSLLTAFQIAPRLSMASPRQIHRALGILAGCLLAVEAFTGLWLCFPQTMRGALSAVSTVSPDVRPVRNGQPSSRRAGLNELMAAAQYALPGGVVREIRLPEGNGSVQVRMWLPGDFRSLGNNVVFLSSGNADVLAVDRYAAQPVPNRLIQSMAALHYDEWGGLPVRALCAAAGLVTPFLFVTGTLIWWYSRRRRTTPAARFKVVEPAAVSTR
ncbi:membrane hypothetical protein [Candidatus Sulfopaludibacter sp. SbA3]|nr:membrane hypothetical protein [Candidatus Sulfopaludibacter sp. SbA3]